MGFVALVLAALCCAPAPCAASIYSFVVNNDYINMGTLERIFSTSGDDNKWDYDRSWQRIESKIWLSCEEFQNEREKFAVSMCKERSKHYHNSYKVTGMAWSGEHQTLQGNQYSTSMNIWRTEYEIVSRQCVPSSYDRYCRRALKCRMEERFYGWLIGAPGFLGETPQLLSRDNVRNGIPNNIVDMCMDCQYVPCEFPANGCLNGRVSGAPVETKAGVIIRVPECGVACAAGTFLTCKGNKECKYRPYTDAEAVRDLAGASQGSLQWFANNVNVLRVDVNLVLPSAGTPPPYAQCYPCWLAADRMHEGVVASTDPVLKQQGYLRFQCPGGAAAPVDCGANEVTKFNATTKEVSACGCKPGLYRTAATALCEPCPAGHFCDWSGMTAPSPRECPADHYATRGAVACTPCDMGRRCDAGQALTRCMQGQGGKFQTENAFCVGCERCQQLQGASALPDAVPCFKVSPKLF